MDKEILDQAMVKGGNHLANLLMSNKDNIAEAFDDLVAKGGSDGKSKASMTVGLSFTIQKNLDGKAGGVKVYASISGKTTFKDSTAPESIDTHPQFENLDDDPNGDDKGE